MLWGGPAAPCGGRWAKARDSSPREIANRVGLSQATGRAVLGTLVSCTAYRPPGVIVKMAENLHTLSGGRFCLGLGAGWDQPEFEFLGIPFPSCGAPEVVQSI